MEKEKYAFRVFTLQLGREGARLKSYLKYRAIPTLWDNIQSLQ